MRAAVKVVRAASDGAERQVKGFIDKFDRKNRTLIRALRKALKERLPTANELVWGNYNFFVIGYSSTERGKMTGKPIKIPSGYLFTEGCDCFIIICVHPKYGIQASAAQRSVNMLIGGDQLELTTAVPCRDKESDRIARDPGVSRQNPSDAAAQ